MVHSTEAETEPIPNLRAAVEQALAALGGGAEAIPADPPEPSDAPSAAVQVLQQEGRLLFAMRRQREQLVREVTGLREERETIRQEVEALVRLGLERRREAAEDVEQLEKRSRELLVAVNALARQVLATLDTAAQLSAALEQRESQAAVEEAEAAPEENPHPAPEVSTEADSTALIAAATGPSVAARPGLVDGLLVWLGLRRRGTHVDTAREVPAISA